MSARSSEPETSIVITCFNREAFIGEAIESALAQGPTTEVIVVDDGSTDGSWKVISSYPKLKSVRIENGGVSAARNRGLALAKGTYVRFHDSDDVIPPDAVSQLLDRARALRQDEIGFGDAITIDGSGKTIGHPTYGFAKVAQPGELPFDALLANAMATPLPLFPRRKLIGVGGFDETLGVSEDWELAIRLALAGVTFVRFPVVVCYVREHDRERASRNYGSQGYREQIRAIEKIWRAVSQRDGKLSVGSRLVFARRIWAIGRAAGRDKCKVESERLFDLAKVAAPAQASLAHPAMTALYAFCSPYRVERLLELVKSIARLRFPGR